MSALFIEARTLAGMSYVRATEVIGVQFVDPGKCTILFASGATVPCSEPAQTVAARIEEAIGGATQTKGAHHGDAGE